MAQNSLQNTEIVHSGRHAAVASAGAADAAAAAVTAVTAVTAAAAAVLSDVVLPSMAVGIQPR